MSNETIMLAKKFDIKKVEFPCVATEKLDGVAADFYGKFDKANGPQCLVRSRQDEPVLSVGHITEFLTGKLPDKAHLICELYIPGRPFKEISGLVRRHETQPELIAYIYDFYVEAYEEYAYRDRMMLMTDLLADHIEEDSPVMFIPGVHLKNAMELEVYIDKFNAQKPEAEGLVIRSLNGKDSDYRAGKRSWGMQKLKNQATMDLQVHSFEEAISKDGEPKGMVGRINVLYDTGASSDGKNEYTDFTVIGAGPGKMSHKERTEVFNNQDKYIGRIAEIGYMPDPEYDALREPRFLRWREDKTKPSQE